MPLFLARLAHAEAATGACLCVGLDPDAERLPRPLRGLPAPDAIRLFNQAIVAATAPFAAAFKLNAAFYEVHGAAAWDLLHDAVEAVRRHAPHALVIYDAKRGDIGNTARFYARAAFHALGADAITVAPYMGADSVLPFLEWTEGCAFVLGRTSNRGAQDFQHLDAGGEPLYRHVVRHVAAWSEQSAGTAGLVAGATDVGALREIRALAPHLPLLVPGVGAQGGSAQAVVEAAGADGAPLLVNSSRDILFADAGDGFAGAAARAARALRDALGR